MWSKDVTFNSKFITKKCLTIYLNLSWFKLYAISPKKPAIYFSRYLQSMKRRQSSCHLVLSTSLKTSSLNFLFSWLVFVISFNNKLYNLFFFSFSRLSCDFHQHNGKKTRDCNFQHRAPIMEGCWTTSASSCFKFWRGSFAHRS